MSCKLFWVGAPAVLSFCCCLTISGCGGDSEVAPSASSENASQTTPTVAHSTVETPTRKPGEPQPDAVRTESPEQSELAESSVEPAGKPLPEVSVTEPGAENAPPAAEPTNQPPRTEPVAAGAEPPATTTDAAARLEEQLAAFTVPPEWLDDVRPKWNTSKPWKEARQEIRNLLGKGEDGSRREGIKLTWEYLQKNDIGDGHEYGMYMFLGGEPLWAIHVYREWLAKDDHSYPPYFGVKALAALYTRYGVFEEAEKVLEQGMTFRSPDPKWNEVRAAELNDAFGDLYTAWGKIDQAKTSYQEAARLFPLGKPPYGRHLLPRKAKKVQDKLDLLSQASLDDTDLNDGTYRETSLGYSGDVQLVVEVKGGRLANVRVTKHQEKIDQNACVLIPQRMSEAQSLQVDGISGATVTRDAIVSGTLSALKKAGLR